MRSRSIRNINYITCVILLVYAASVVSPQTARQTETAHALNFIVVVPQYEVDERCGGCTVLWQMHQDLKERGFHVRMHLIDEGPSCQSNSKTVVIYPEIVAWTCQPDTMLNIRWLLAPIGAYAPWTMPGSWSPQDWVFNYGRNAPRAAMKVPNSNILMLMRNPYPGDQFDIKHQTHGTREGWCYTYRKASIFHNMSDLEKLHPESASELPATVLEDVSEFLQKKYFVSYDPYTALTWIATWLGCVSIVHPVKGLSKREWFESTNWGAYALATGSYILMDGIAYGTNEEEIHRAAQMLPMMRSESEKLRNWGQYTLTRMLNDVKVFEHEGDTFLARKLVSDFFPPNWYEDE